MPGEKKHRKSRLGCERCKTRKVKCDEGKPRCGACGRHGVECIYAHPSQQNHLDTASDSRVTTTVPALLSPIDTPPTSKDPSSTSRQPTPTSPRNYSQLELRMLHFFVAKTSEAISASINLWKVRVPLVAFDRPPVFDLVMALAALHITREKEYGVLPADPEAWGQFLGANSFLDRQSVDELRTLSENYFNSGVQSHRIAVSEATTFPDYEGIFIGAILIALYSLYMLGDIRTATAPYSENLWFQLSSGVRQIGKRWVQAEGPHVIHRLGVDDAEPSVIVDPELKNAENARPFRPLLEFGRDFEMVTEEEEEVYEEVLIYIGLMYRRAFTRAESPRATCRRLFAFPSKLPPLFRDLVFEQRPRALALLIIAFAIGKLIEDDMILLKGVARNQIPGMMDRLPNAWREFLCWPLGVLEMDTSDPQSWPEIYFREVA